MRQSDTFQKVFANGVPTTDILGSLHKDLDYLSHKYSHCVFKYVAMSEELYDKINGLCAICNLFNGAIDVKASLNSHDLVYCIFFEYDDGAIPAVNADPKKIWLSTVSAFDTTDWFPKAMREKIDAAVERAKHTDWVDTFRYTMTDVFTMREFYKQIEEDEMRPKLRIKNVIFNDPATIVFWYDGTKTVVKCQPGDTFDHEKGLAMAICKKILGTNGSQSNFNKIFKKWLPKKEEKKEPKVIGKIKDMTITDKGLVVKAEITDAEFAPNINEILGILGE